MRVMYDAIYPKNIPPGAKVVASYVDGKWPNYAEAVKLFPRALHLSIAVFPQDDAHCLDVEQYDATPAQAPAWAARQRAKGNHYPWVYMNAATWPAVRNQFRAQKVPEPLYWVANYDGQHTIPVGAIGHQYQGTTAPGFDVSVIADYIPGFDPPPPPPHPAAPHYVYGNHPTHDDNIVDKSGSWALYLTADGHLDLRHNGTHVRYL